MAATPFSADRTNRSPALCRSSRRAYPFLTPFLSAHLSMSTTERSTVSADPSAPPAQPALAPPATRILYCLSGSWTDAWYDDPGAWWQWCCAFLGWAPDQW